MIPTEIRNRIADARQRAESPPNLCGVRGDIRNAIERDYRAIRDHLRAFDEWFRWVDTVTLRQK